MPNIQDTTKKRIQFEQQLKAEYGGDEGVVPIISIEHFDLIEHKPGVVFECHPPVAARMIYRHTHRIATGEEYQAYKEDLAARTAKCAEIEAERRMREGKFAIISDNRGSESNAATLQLIAQLQTELSQLRQAQQLQASAKSSAPAPPAGRTKQDA